MTQADATNPNNPPATSRMVLMDGPGIARFATLAGEYDIHPMTHLSAESFEETKNGLLVHLKANHWPGGGDSSTVFISKPKSE